MGDTDNIPEMNGTIKALVSLLTEDISTSEKQQQALKELVKLQLNSYMLQKQVYEKLSSLLEERKSILSKMVDKLLAPLAYTILTILLWLVFSNFKP